MKRLKISHSNKDQQIARFELKTEKKAKKRARKIKPKMRVSGKSVFNLQTTIKKRAK